MIRAAGFARAEIRLVLGKSAQVVGWRKWGEFPTPTDVPLELLRIHCHSNRGRTFHSSKEEYICAWVRWDNPEVPPLSEIYPEVDEFGVAPEVMIGRITKSSSMTFRQAPHRFI